MNRLLFVTSASVTLHLASVMPATGQQTSDSGRARCAVITDPEHRLRCYDVLRKGPDSSQGENQPAQSAGRRIGNWIVIEERTNLAGDSKPVLLVLAAHEGRSLSGKAPLLILRCQRGNLDVYINWIDYLGPVPADVSTQLGAGSAERKTWKHSTDNRATFYPGNKTKLVKSLLTVDRFSAQVTPFRQSPITAVFELQGLADALAPLRSACGLE